MKMNVYGKRITPEYEEIDARRMIEALAGRQMPQVQAKEMSLEEALAGGRIEAPEAPIEYPEIEMMGLSEVSDRIQRPRFDRSQMTPEELEADTQKFRREKSPYGVESGENMERAARRRLEENYGPMSDDQFIQLYQNYLMQSR
jgi:hypothetical protein